MQLEVIRGDTTAKRVYVHYAVGYLVSLRTKYLKRNRYRRINFCHDTGAIFTRVKKWTNEIVV